MLIQSHLFPRLSRNTFYFSIHDSIIFLFVVTFLVFCYCHTTLISNTVELLFLKLYIDRTLGSFMIINWMRGFSHWKFSPFLFLKWVWAKEIAIRINWQEYDFLCNLDLTASCWTWSTSGSHDQPSWCSASGIVHHSSRVFHPQRSTVSFHGSSGNHDLFCYFRLSKGGRSVFYMCLQFFLKSSMSDCDLWDTVVCEDPYSH